MTLAELQPQVEAAIEAFEWEIASVRWRRGLIEEREAIEKAIPLAGQFGVEEAPLRARLGQIVAEMRTNVTADRVSLHPLRSVPMDLITAAVVRRILRLPADFPILSVKAPPTRKQLHDAVREIANRWQTPMGSIADEITQTVAHV